MHKADVVIAGGGLAGLGLAWQLASARPDTRIVVLEKHAFPRPLATAKVGESTVEIGSHYLAERLQLREHLQQRHLKKFGIRMFFGDWQRLEEADELGASNTFGIPTYQIDRGDLENVLAERVRALGVTLLEQCDIDGLEIAAMGDEHRVHFQQAGASHTVQARWCVDAAGRAALLKNELGLAESNAHRSNAVWFRIDRRIELDHWSADEDWHARCELKQQRWLSTNHLCGPGYWVWIIPLASGVTSIGIVMDDTCLASADFSTFASTSTWLQQHQPALARAIEGAPLLDYVLLKDYSYGCRQVFSEQRWAITGEAGVFADPFYSPGSDFIAIANEFIASLVLADLDGEDIRLRARLFNSVFLSIYNNTLSLYTEQYGGFGDRTMMSLKLLWDYSYYWGVLSLMYFRRGLSDVETLRQISPALQRAQSLNQQVQAAFRARARLRRVESVRGVFLDQFHIPCLHHFNEQLKQGEQGVLLEDLEENLPKLALIAESVMAMLHEDADPQPCDAEFALLGEYRRLVLG